MRLNQNMRGTQTFRPAVVPWTHSREKSRLSNRCPISVGTAIPPALRAILCLDDQPFSKHIKPKVAGNHDEKENMRLFFTKKRFRRNPTHPTTFCHPRMGDETFLKPLSPIFDGYIPYCKIILYIILC